MPQRRKRPVEPLWPYGAVAQMVIVPASETGTGEPSMGLRKLTVTNATKTADGWRIVAQSPNKVVRFIDVDEEGIGDDCEPWEDEHEEKFGPADPEHNVVILNHAEHTAPQAEPEPEQPPAEVFDINAKWAERDAKIHKFVADVGRLQEQSVIAEHQANIKRFSDRVADLLLVAKDPEEREIAKQAERVVVAYRDLSPRKARQVVQSVEEKLAESEAILRAPRSVRLAYRGLIDKSIQVDEDQERKEAQRRAEARKADRHGTQ